MATARTRTKSDRLEAKLSSPVRRRAETGRATSGSERDWQVVDHFPQPIPISADEVRAVETYLWPLIEALLKEHA